MAVFPDVLTTLASKPRGHRQYTHGHRRQPTDRLGRRTQKLSSSSPTELPEHSLRTHKKPYQSTSISLLLPNVQSRLRNSFVSVQIYKLLRSTTGLVFVGTETNKEGHLGTCGISGCFAVQWQAIGLPTKSFYVSSDLCCL